MSELDGEIAGTFVEPRGMIRSIIAATAGREVLGAVGATAAASAASAGTAESSPLKKGQIAYLSVSTERITMFRAKRGAFRPKSTTQTIASAPRAEIRSATVQKGRIAGVLEIAFNDAEAWTFDVPKVHLAGAQAIAAALT
jgi:hypothetical protein